jgi:hypothetical protein
MAEQTILVCDVCGQPATASVSMRVGRRSLTKDLCDTHLSELTAGARAARPGRRKGTTVARATKRGPGRRLKKAKAPINPKRRPGRPRKSQAAAS